MTTISSEDRIAKLERQNRWLRVLVISTAILAAFAAVASYRQWASTAVTRNRTIEAEEFVM